MKYIIVKNGVIDNICVVNEESVISENMFPYTFGNIGDLYDNGTITPVIPEVIVPEEVTAVQLKQSCYHYGIFYQIDAALKQMNGEIYIWWLNATVFHRNDARLIAASIELNNAGYTHNLDDLFIYAKSVI